MKIDPKDLQIETEDFFNKIGISLTASVSEKDDGYNIDLKASDTGLLIGYHGDTLADFQLILLLFQGSSIVGFGKNKHLLFK